VLVEMTSLQLVPWY